MTIDAELAWRALLRARVLWRPGAVPATVQAPPGETPRLELSPDGSWRSIGAPVEAGSAALLELYLPLLRPRIVIGQLGQSLDGRIATASGHSHYLNGPDSIAHLHRLRALADAVVVGAGTVVADGPQLTVRHCSGANPLRVVLDARGRVPADRRIFTDPTAPTLVIRSEGAAGPGLAEAETLPLDPDGGFRPADVLGLLAARGAHRVLVEGGGVTVSRFLAAGALDMLHVMVAPMLIGGGRPGLTLPPIERLDSALRPAHRRIAFGDDMLFELRLS